MSITVINQVTRLHSIKYSLLALCVGSQFAHADGHDTQKRLSELEARLVKLEQALASKDSQIKQLESQLIKTGVATGEVATKVASEETAVYQHDKSTVSSHSRAFEQRPSHRYKAPERSIRLSGTDTRLQIGGQIWLDAIYSDGNMTNRAGFQPSSISYAENTVDDNTLLTVGQSKLYFKSFTPTKYGDMKTRFEFDMFQADGNASFHLTHLWGELGDFGAGQTFSGFMDIDAFPNTLEYWGPNSMVFTRQPQIRYTMHVNEQDKFALSLERSDSDFALPRDYDSIDFDEVNELPDLTAYYYTSGDFGHFKSALILRRLGYETIDASDSTTGWGINVSGAYALTVNNSLKYQLVYGRGIGRYINDTCCSYYAEATGGSDAGLNSNGDLTPITAKGGFVYLDHHWNEAMSTAVGVSYLTVDNLSTQRDNAFSNSLYSTANFIWTPTLMSKVGIELQYGEVESKAGSNGDDLRIQTSFGFKY
jgi:uncharacterized coiled-coil protein SlyX